MDKKLLWSLGCYLAFVFGQFLFLLKRAYSAKQNQSTIVTSIPEYFRLSGVPIFIRLCLEGALYYVLLHYKVAVNWLLSLWGWHLPAGFVASDYANPVLTGLAGYAVDSIIDGLVFSKKLPEGLRNWIKENVPQNIYGVAAKENVMKETAT